MNCFQWIKKTGVLLLLGMAPYASAGSLQLSLIGEGFNRPLFVTPAPGEKDKLFVVEQHGVVKVLEDSKISPTPLLDVRAKVNWGGEKGLLGLAFHPDFANNKKFYVNYTARGSRLKTVIIEFKVGSKNERELLSYRQPYANHNGGHLAFNPVEGKPYLYITVGDGGLANDPLDAGQNTNMLLGKILRIDVDGKQPYGIPGDNPFAKSGGKPEIFAFGLRNAWRFSFDSQTGLMFAGDVGQNRFEEVDIIEKGKNYGWNTMEGMHCFDPPTNCEKKGLELPIWEYPRAEGVSITGGYVYRGSKIAGLKGVYVYGDFGSGKVWGLHYDQQKRRTVKNELLLETGLPISSFGEDADGELLVVDYGGRIYQVESKSQ